MRSRRGAGELCNGPGKLTQAMGIGLTENDTSLIDGPIAIRAGEPLEYVTGPRIGITKAAELPWRFCALGYRDVSRPWPPGFRDSLKRRAASRARLRRHAAPRAAARPSRCRRRRRRRSAAPCRRRRIDRRRLGGRRRRRRHGGRRRRGRRGRLRHRVGRRRCGPAAVGRRRRGGRDGRRARQGGARRRGRLGAAVAAVVLGQRVDLEQRHHEALPDRGRERAAGDRLALELASPSA